MVAWSATVAAQSWRAGTLITPPLRLPAVSGITGNLVYAASDVPDGVIVDFASRTIYGIPETAGDGTITITAADDTPSSVDIEVSYTIAERYVPIVVPAVPDLTLDVGRSFNYDFPAPSGGSGNFTTSLEFRPPPPWNNRPVRITSLPEGLTYSPGPPGGTRHLGGIVADSVANRAEQTISQLSLNNAQVSADGLTTGFITTNTRGGGMASLTGSNFNYPALVGKQYDWVTVGTHAGTFFARVFPHIDELADALPNNPTIFVLRQSDFAVLASFPVAVAERITMPSLRMSWPTDFVFEEGEDYYIEIGTSSRSGYNYVVTDDDTGLTAKTPFTMFLASPQAGAPPRPALVGSAPHITSVQVTLQGYDLPDVRNIVAGAMPAGFPVIRTRLRNHPYTNDVDNEVVIGDLDPATEYDIYIYYEDNQGRRSVPLVVELETEPARPAIPPLPVSGLTAEPGPNRLRLTWDDLPPFQRITGLEYRIDNGVWANIPNSGGASVGAVIPGLIDGEQVTIDVRVRNPDGVSAVRSVSGTPGQGVPPPFRTPIQSRILVDFDGLLVPLENRVLSANGEMGRQPGTFDPAPGWAEVVLVASDGFIRVIDPEDQQGLYSASDLRNRRCLIQELYEGPTGRTIPVTRFGGWIEAAPLSSEGEEQFVTLSVVDRLGQYARRLVRFTSPVPREYADDRARRILAAAAVPEGEVEVPPNRVWCGNRHAAFDSPYEGTLLAFLAGVANSTAGRLIVVENQQTDGIPDVGQLRLEPVTPTRPASVTLSDNPGRDAARWGPIAEIGNQPPAVLDPTNVYNQVEINIGTEQVIASEAESIAVWGGRLFPVSDVVVERDEAEALARHALRVYSQPRLLADKVTCHLHFQEPAVAAVVAGLTLADTVRLSYVPSGSDYQVAAVQQIDHIRWSHMPGDRQYCQVSLEIGMLAPEATSFWIASEEGNNRLGQETWLAPTSADTLVSGGYQFSYNPENLEPAYVTADRYALLANQTWPVYGSEQERNEYEIDPADGQGCIITGDRGEGTSPRFYYHLDVYSSYDNQWITRGRLSDADANPVTDRLTWDTDSWDDGKVWAA